MYTCINVYVYVYIHMCLYIYIYIYQCMYISPPTPGEAGGSDAAPGRALGAGPGRGPIVII